MTFTRAGETVGVQVTAAITRRSDSLWSGGLIGVTEDHYRGYIIASSLTDHPDIGDTLATSIGDIYEIDQAPIEAFGLLTLILRKLR